MSTYTGSDVSLPFGYEDNFGKAIADSTQNEADIAGHYPFTPERWRVFVDGTRQFIQYGDISQYNDIVDGHELIPAQGEVVTMKTAEKYRYIVGYVIRPSFAFEVSRTLETGDKVVIGYGEPDLNNDMNNADGWFFIYRPDLKDTEVEIAEYRNGTEVDSSVVNITKGIDIWKRLAIDLNWYNVGNAIYTETYTTDSEQRNEIIGQTSVDDDKGPEQGNQHITFSVKRGASSSALTLEAGSVGLQTLGDVDVIERIKVAANDYTFSTTDAWVPILAVRTDPDREVVSSQLSDVQITGWDGSDDVEIAAQIHGPSKVQKAADTELTDSDYATPELHATQNSVIEESTAVDRGPRESDGTIQTSITDSEGPGGYQVGYAEFTSSGQGNKTQTTNTSKVRKRTINPEDVVVFWGRADNASSVRWQWTTEQDW